LRIAKRVSQKITFLKVAVIFDEEKILIVKKNIGRRDQMSTIKKLKYFQMKSKNNINSQLSKANSFLFFGITAGFVFIAFLFGYYTKDAEVVIPAAVCIGIVLTAIGLLLFEPSAGMKEAKY
jgi:hypothetical protein